MNAPSHTKPLICATVALATMAGGCVSINPDPTYPVATQPDKLFGKIESTNRRATKPPALLNGTGPLAVDTNELDALAEAAEGLAAAYERRQALRSSAPAPTPEVLPARADATERRPVHPVQRRTSAPALRPDLLIPDATTPTRRTLTQAANRPSAQERAPRVTTQADARHAAAQTELAVQLANQIASNLQTATDPMRDAIRLAALEAIEPNATNDSARALDQALTEPEQRTLRVVRELLGSLAADDGLADPDRISSLLERHAEKLRAAGSLSIPNAQLCTSVASFGVYTPVEQNTFLAGSDMPVVVYAEIDNFSQKPDAGSGDHLVELGVEMRLYHDADDVLAWRMKEEPVRDESKRKRRDFFIARIVELPSTLTIGRYNLKVIVRDKQSGSTAEENIRLDVVADRSALR